MRLASRLCCAALVIAASSTTSQAQGPPETDVCEIGQAQAFLDAGGVRAALYNIGGLFWRGSGSTYEVPRGSETTPIFSAAFWLGGMAEDELRFAGSRYGPWEYWPGPLDIAAEPSADLCAAFDRVWVVSTADLAAFRQSGAATADLAEWPVGAGAPFYVDADGDGTQGPAEPTVALRPGDPAYDPARTIRLADGERPVVFGAQTAWWVMDDLGGDHRWSESAPLGVEVRVTAWALADADRAPLFYSTFYRYEILNRSAEALDDVFAALHVDADLGEATDDYVHSDSARSMLVFYNGDELDGRTDGTGGYGVPPALGIDVLSGGHAAMNVLKSSVFTARDGPSAYRFMQAQFADGTPLRVGGDGYHTDGPATRWMYSGDPVARSFWTEDNVDGMGRSNNPADRRAMISAEIGRLDPGEETTVDVGILFAQGGDRLDSVARLRGVSDTAQGAYASGDLFRPATANGTPQAPEPPSTAPALVSPTDGASFDDGPVTFAWTAVDGATGYRLELSTAPDFADPTVSLGPETSRGLPAGSFPPNRATPSYWRVVPLTLNVAGPPSEARQITLYRYAPGPLLLGDGAPAFVEVVGPGGVDPCGPEAESADGCDEVGGNRIYGSLNSTGDYIGTSAGAGPEASIGDSAPNDFEIRFTDEGGYAVYGFSTDNVIPVPFEVWDIGVVAPGTANDPSDDERLVPFLFADADDDGTPIDECVFGYFGASQFGIGTITPRIYGYYAKTAYADFAAAAGAALAGDPDQCAVSAEAHDVADVDRGRPIQRFVLEQASETGIDGLTGTVIRFYTADPLDVPIEPAPDAAGLSLAAHPNPISGVASVPFSLAAAGDVRLRVVDVLGREVAVLAKGPRSAGAHRATLDASRLAAGVYVVVLDAGGARVTRTVTVVR